MITAGVTSNLLCLFPSRAEVTDYSLNLADMNGAYNFVGLYTKGEYDENGYLKCYYWEAGVLQEMRLHDVYGYSYYYLYVLI